MLESQETNIQLAEECFSRRVNRLCFTLLAFGFDIAFPLRIFRRTNDLVVKQNSDSGMPNVIRWS